MLYAPFDPVASPDAAKHIAMVLNADGLDGPEKLLLIAYCSQADDQGYCALGHKRLADDCGTSIATVKRVRQRLIEKYMIGSILRTDPETGEPITSLTRVNLERLAVMQRPDTGVVAEVITFDADAPLPTKRRKAKRARD